MIVLPKNIKNSTVEELTQYLITNYTVGHIASTLAEFLVKPQIQPIIVTEEELASINALFRVKGITTEGAKETRGRKPKIKPTID